MAWKKAKSVQFVSSWRRRKLKKKNRTFKTKKIVYMQLAEIHED